MRYLALIYSEEMDPATVDPAQMGQVMAEYNRFGRDAGAAGVLRGGEALQPTATATTIRVRNGQRETTDGPFAETREVLGGYYLLDCRDLDEAIEWAAQIPGAWHGCVELRPILEWSAEDLAMGV
jgi:hypothetical protein